MVNSRGNGSSNDNGQSAKRSRQDSPPGSRQQQAKRSRVSRACDQCRASRERCDGVMPACQTCKALDRSCSYNEQPKKRGIQPNYIRTLELTIAWLFRTYPGAEKNLADALPDEDNDARALIGSKDIEATDELHQAWRASLVNKQIEQVLSGIPVERRMPTGSSPADVLGPISRPIAATTSYSSPPASAGSEPPNTHQTVAVSDTPSAQNYSMYSASNPKVEKQRYQLPGNAWTLLEYYFAFTHAWLPMTGKHNIMKIMYTYPPDGLLFEQVNSAEHAELWAIMALTSFQVPGEQAPSDQNLIGRLADSLLPPPGSAYEIPHIRALILRALDDLQREQILAAWLRIGSVARLLHLFKLLESLGNTARWCRHVHLAAFIIEGALAQRLNTVGHFRTDYVRNVGFVDEDGLDEWAPWIDPLQQNDIMTAAKAPAKAFSNLNELARFYMRLAESDPPSSGLPSPSADVEGSIVSLLLQNASAKRDRVQPWQLVATYCSSGSQKGLDWPPAGHSGMDGDWMVPTNVGTRPAQTDASSVPSQSHPFMAMPNDGDHIDSTPARSDMQTLWPPDVPMHDPTLAIDPILEDGGSSMDIFEELATLERQDSMHRPQFMQNLGFPDLDLAEFFGTDYQVSDPLLSYLQPDQLGRRVRGNSTGSYG